MVYLFLADGFEIVEAMAPLDMLRRAKVDVKTVGLFSRTVTCSKGVELKADLSMDEVDMKNCEMIILPGGLPGAEHLRDSEEIGEIVDYAEASGLYIAAICAAPMVIGRRGVLRGKKATCFPGYEDELLGAECTGEGVVRDGKVITAKGAGRSVEFGLALVEALCGREKAAEIKEKIQC
ncbi:MAG: DJ-1 family glyoxalase III [Clostridia bacterium]